MSLNLNCPRRVFIGQTVTTEIGGKVKRVRVDLERSPLTRNKVNVVAQVVTLKGEAFEPPMPMEIAGFEHDEESGNWFYYPPKGAEWARH